MKDRPFIIEESHWKAIKDINFSIVVLPWGATEAHNYHLPYGTDIIQSKYIAAESAAYAWKKGVKVAVLPAIPFGVNTGQLDINMVINMNPSTQYKILYDVIFSLKNYSAKKFVIVNSHGGNDFKQLLRELQLEFPDMLLSQLNWYKALDLNKYFDEPGDHAGEMETCVMMKIAPELVLPVETAGDGRENKFKINGFKQGWAWSQRQWTKITKDTGVGDPRRATLEKGEKFLNDLIPVLGNFFVDLDKADINNLFE